MSAMVSVVLAWTMATSGDHPVDRILKDAQASARVAVAERCDDDTFVRRSCLDLIGRIPTEDEWRQFRDQPDRSRWIEQLVARPAFAQHMSEVWTAAWMGFANDGQADRELLRMWLQDQLQSDVPFDRIGQSLIAGRGDSAVNGPVNFVLQHGDDAGVQVARQFLGVRLDCARCHDHPFANWTQDDFAKFSRFFSLVEMTDISRGNIRVTDRLAEPDEADMPRFLNGGRPQTSQWRSELALWTIRSRSFARNFANRTWYHFMGQGIVDPPDETHSVQQASCRPLLEFLADYSRRHEFSIRDLATLICTSEAYQRSSADPITDDNAVLLFAVHPLKPLTPEQLFDSIATAYQLKPDASERREFVQSHRGNVLDQDFVLTWKYRETCQQLLDRMTTDSLPTWSGDLDSVFLRLLSRHPTPAQRELCRTHSIETVAFALLQSNEFVFSH
ncbi:MAG: DUF1549 domain-containing protein [Pirellulaceae bacterium]|nr:DUF1549 domain-containing protein [Planctomycetales bacterium]